MEKVEELNVNYNELKLATIVQLMNEKAVQQGLTQEVTPEQVVKLPDNGCKGFMGIPHWDVYAARVQEYVCLVYVYADGRVNVFLHC